MKINHAIILLAGYGTRRLPISKAVEKCILPVLNRPIIDYIVEDCVRAVIDHIVFVTSEGASQVQKYYSRDTVLERYLREHGKDQKYLDMITPPEVNFDFVEQSNELLFGQYGTNTAVALARPLIPKGESALVIMGDAIMYDGGDGNPIADFIKTAGTDSAVMGMEVPRKEVFRYGVLVTKDDGYLDHMVEKPSVEDAPSNVINLGEYVLTSDLLDETTRFFDESYPPGKEKYVNLEPLDRYIQKGGKVKVVPASGTYLDVGTVENWLRANIVVAQNEGIEI